MSIESDVELYFASSAENYAEGQQEYFASRALERAVRASRQGNYGVGAVAVMATSSTVFEFPNQDATVTGPGVTDHAIIRAVLDIRSRAVPSRIYKRKVNEWAQALPQGVSVFSTVEACPMCAYALANVGARLAVSTIQSSDLEVGNHEVGNGKDVSERIRMQSRVWQHVQSQVGTSFELLDTDDERLVSLTKRIFGETKDAVDQKVAARAQRRAII